MRSVGLGVIFFFLSLAFSFFSPAFGHDDFNASDTSCLSRIRYRH